MDHVVFTPDQNMAILQWLEYLNSCMLTLPEVIKGLTDGTLTAVEINPSISQSSNNV